ncbi:MAG: serine/threonine protein kinase [Polyangiaceae bacterium]|nr:serine/threonine protein kinase [Polyangiaceae bacterium]
MAEQREKDGSERNAPRERPSGTSKKSTGPDPLLGRTVNGRYKIVALIARGGMGKVYKAEQQPLGRTCALKVLNPRYEGDRDPEFGKRFFLEAATAAKLTHPNTVTIFDYGSSEDGDIYYIAMEYIEGKTLHRILREDTTLNEARTSHIARQICRSLREAHEHGVVHRDLKPGNILLTNRGDENDVVKVLDFGLVKDVTGDAEDLTQQGLFMGSPKYMAPEQITGGEISARTDIYSLGVMIYEMMTGKVPFDRGASVNTLMAHVNDAPPPLVEANPQIQISPQMEMIIARCLEKDPAKRFASMNELLVALKRTGDPTMTDTHDNLPAAYISRASGVDSGPTAASISIPASVRNPPLSPDMVPDNPSRTPGPFNTDRPADPSHSDLQAGMPSLVHLSQQKKGRPTTSYVLVGLAAAAIAAVAFLSLRKPPENAASGESSHAASGTGGPTGNTASTGTAAGNQTTSATATSTPSTTGSESASAADRVVRIESEPPGASVTEDGKELCAATPCDVTFKGESASSGKEHKLTLNKSGFKSTALTVGAAEAKASTKLSVWVGGGGPVAAPTQTSTAPAKFDGCLDDSDCKGGKKCMHGWCK